MLSIVNFNYQKRDTLFSSMLFHENHFFCFPAKRAMLLLEVIFHETNQRYPFV